MILRILMLAACLCVLVCAHGGSNGTRPDGDGGPKARNDTSPHPGRNGTTDRIPRGSFNDTTGSHGYRGNKSDASYVTGGRRLRLLLGAPGLYRHGSPKPDNGTGSGLRPSPPLIDSRNGTGDHTNGTDFPPGRNSTGLPPRPSGGSNHTEGGNGTQFNGNGGKP
jgi:hypothetical protein